MACSRIPHILAAETRKIFNFIILSESLHSNKYKYYGNILRQEKDKTQSSEINLLMKKSIGKVMYLPHLNIAVELRIVGVATCSRLLLYCRKYFRLRVFIRMGINLDDIRRRLPIRSGSHVLSLQLN